MTVVAAALGGLARHVEVWRGHAAAREAAAALNAFSHWRGGGPPPPDDTADLASPLRGSLFATKANICALGLKATAGSRMLEAYVAPYDAVAVERLGRAGAVVGGATNMDEFGMGSATAYSVHGPSFNPFSAPVTIGRVVAAVAAEAAATTSGAPHTAAAPPRRGETSLLTPPADGGWIPPPPSSPSWLTPGGSSGGSAIAVAVSAVSFALGSDTGGSVRQPAAFCGVVGLKPSYGRVPRWGLIPYASSLDTVGVLARCVADAAAVFDVIAGPDARDDTSVQAAARHGGSHLPSAPTMRAVLSAAAAASPSSSSSSLRGGPAYMAWRASAARSTHAHSCSGGEAWHLSDALAALPLAGLRVGIPREYSVEGLGSEIGDWWEAGARWLADAGASIHAVSLPHTPAALPAYYVIAPAEAASNLSRYDGVRYGYRTAATATTTTTATAPSTPHNAAAELHAEYSRTRTEGFGAEVQRRVLAGNFVLSRGGRAQFYDAAQAARGLVAADFTAVFRPIGSAGASPHGVDVLLTPTAPTLPWSSATTPQQDPVAMLSNDVMTVPASLAGLPALSLPVGYAAYPPHLLGAALAEAGAAGVPLSASTVSRVEGLARLPVGLQLIGRPWDEDTLLAVGAVMEGAAAFELPDFFGGLTQQRRQQG